MKLLDFEVLKAAEYLMRHRQHEQYWARYPTPERPTGAVRYEAARMVLTFLGPALLMLAAGLFGGKIGFIAAAPIAWLAGYGLDRALKKAIRTRLQFELSIDRGRYYAAGFIAQKTGIAVERITLPVVYRLSQLYHAELRRQEEQAAKEETARQRWLSRRGYGRQRVGPGNDRRGGYFGDEGEALTSPLPLNPATGLPMANPMFDTAGNSFGLNTMSNDPGAPRYGFEPTAAGHSAWENVDR